MLNFAHDYKYLGFWIKEFLDMVEAISKSTNRALSLSIAAKSNGGFSLDIFSRIFDATFAVIPITPNYSFQCPPWDL